MAKITISYNFNDNGILLCHINPIKYSYGSKLIVKSNQIALIRDYNAVIKILSEGQYILDNKLIESLSTYQNSKDVLPYDIYFINKNNMIINSTFGSHENITLNDAVYQDVVLHLKIRGSLIIKLNDFNNFFNSLLDRFLSNNVVYINSLQIFINRQINEILKPFLSDYVIKNNLTYRQFKTNLLQIQDYFKEKLNTILYAYGFMLDNFNILDIRASHDDVELLKEKDSQNNTISDYLVANECLHCGASLNENNERCPYCGNNNPYYIQTNNSTMPNNTVNGKQKRDLNVAIFVLLIIFFWPGAIIYYLYCEGEI